MSPGVLALNRRFYDILYRVLRNSNITWHSNGLSFENSEIFIALAVCFYVELPASSVQVIGLCISFALCMKQEGNMFEEANEKRIYI
jgi:hypothetical protein